MTDETLGIIVEQQRHIYEELTRNNGRNDTLQGLALALDVLHRDVCALRDDLRVISAMVVRTDHSLSDLLLDIRTAYDKQTAISERVTALEQRR